MLELTGYTITEKLYEDLKTIIYRGHRLKDHHPILLKSVFNDFQGIQLHHEYEITKDLNLTGILQPYTLEHNHNTWILTLEDVQGHLLKNIMTTKVIELVTFLQMAISLTETLNQLHIHQIIHKNIATTSIMVNLQTGQVKLTDFIRSSRFPTEQQSITVPNLLTGTLASISPEQTGRMNHTIDYRTDFYSLGCVFYEMLVGHPPFKSTDAIELVQAHLSKLPPSPQSLKPKVPQPVSDIVMKLLAKNPDARYQSSYGLKADLQICWDQLQETGRIEPFNCGQQDISEKFQVPQTLYGRDSEINTLVSSFERSVEAAKTHSPSQVEIALVSGADGIGKTRLVNEIYKPITKYQGYFISGQFDSFQPHIPYRALIEAFSQLIQQLLVEDQAKLNQWRDKLLVALSPNAQIIIDVLPELEQIIGKQPAVQTLNPIEAQNRFYLTFQNFIKVFCQPNHPLVIFLDDLQWVDVASLKLLEWIIQDDEIFSLFLIWAYRENEINDSHPLRKTLAYLKEQAVPVHYISLKPLPIEVINQLVADTLYRGEEVSQPLAHWVMAKTGGNPFFFNQIFNALYEENWFNFGLPQLNFELELDDPNDELQLLKACGEWQWDIEQIKQVDIADHIVELIINSLKKLPIKTRELLGLAAFLDNQFDLDTLSLIIGQPISETYQILIPAITKGWIITTEQLGRNKTIQTIFTFSHHQVRQAAYTLIEADREFSLHLKIGRLFLSNTSDIERFDKIFEILNHLNQGRTQLNDSSEKRELVLLNLEAAQKAKALLAYAEALVYLNVAMEFLSDQDWHQDYDITFALHQEKAELEYLNGYFEQSKRSIDLLLAQSTSALEQANIYNLLITQNTIRSQFEKAIQAGYKALQLIDIELPDKDLQTALKKELDLASKNLGHRKIASLINEPQIRNHSIQIAIKLLVNMAVPAFFANHALFEIIHLKVVNLSLRYGHMAESSFGYAYYGMVLGRVLENYQVGYQFGDLAIELSNKFNNINQKCQICLVLGNSLMPWVKPVKQADILNYEGYQACLASGHLQLAGYLLFHTVIAKFFQGDKLDYLKAEMTQFSLFNQKQNNELAHHVILAYQMAILNLQGLTQDQWSFHTDQLTESQYFTLCEKNQSYIALCAFQLLKSQLLYLYGKPAEALDYCRLAEQHLPRTFINLLVAEHNFYYSLILIALYTEASDEDKQQYTAILAANQKQMKRWADHCPENFLHKYLLIEAERTRLSEEMLKAMDLYDLAIKLARENYFVQIEALGHELAARFWLERGKEEFAQLYLNRAHYTYQMWGAKRKVEDLVEKYPLWLDQSETTNLNAPLINQNITPSQTAALELGVENPLNLATIMKASQATSGGIVFNHLIKKLMHLVMENVKAKQGWLVLKRHLISNQEIETVETENIELVLEAYATLEQVQIIKAIPLTEIDNGQHDAISPSKSIINYVARTQMALILTDASHHHLFANDRHILQKQPKSVLGMPIIHQQQLIGVFYLENNLTTGLFTQAHVDTLKVLSTQIAISIENALFYAQLEQAHFAAEQARTAAEQARRDAEAANRAKSTFLANMSHELRTPLNAILGYSEIIQEDAEELGYNVILPDIEKIQTAGIQLLGIITDLLDISKIEAEKLELNLSEFSVRQLVEDMMTTIRLLVEMEGNTLLVEYGDNLGNLYADYQKVAQILLNLLNNAAKFTHKGVVTFSITREKQASNIPLLTGGTKKVESDWIFFQITDTGIGIPQDKWNIIFDAFTQVDNSSTREHGGSGLGLTISKHFCHAMGGHISVTSEVGKGSIFTVQLPSQVV